MIDFFATKISLSRLKQAVKRNDAAFVLNQICLSRSRSSSLVLLQALKNLWDLSANDTLRHFMLQHHTIDLILDAMERFRHVEQIQIIGAGVACNLTIDPSLVPSNPDSERDLTSLFSMVGHVIRPLLEAIRSDPFEHDTSKNAWILWSIAHEDEGIEDIMRHDGMTIVLNFLNLQMNNPTGNISLDTVKNTAGLLWNLTENIDASSRTLEELGIDGIVSIMRRVCHHKVDYNLCGVLINLVHVADSMQDKMSLMNAAVDTFLYNHSSDEVARNVQVLLYTISIKWSQKEFAECVKQSKAIDRIASLLGVSSDIHDIFTTSVVLRDLLSYDDADGVVRTIFLRNRKFGLSFLVERSAKLYTSNHRMPLSHRAVLVVSEEILSMYPSTIRLSGVCNISDSKVFANHLEPYNLSMKKRL